MEERKKAGRGGIKARIKGGRTRNGQERKNRQEVRVEEIRGRKEYTRLWEIGQMNEPIVLHILRTTHN